MDGQTDELVVQSFFSVYVKTSPPKLSVNKQPNTEEEQNSVRNKPQFTH